MKFVIPTLEYSFSDLEPVISEEIMRVHYEKHHQAYIDNFNASLERLNIAIDKQDAISILAEQNAIKFNGGGHINHCLFWKNLAPISKGGGLLSEGPLLNIINNKYKSLDNLIDVFNKKTVAIQGSGWGWLAFSKETGDLCVVTTSNQDSLQSVSNLIPLLGIDVWEHAYYLQYKNVRMNYLKEIWKIINWVEVEARYKAALL